MKNRQKTPSGTGPSQRQLRVGEQIRHIIAKTLQKGHFRDEILIDASADITVTEVRPSPDLKQATAYVISLGGKDMEEYLAGNPDSPMAADSHLAAARGQRGAGA